MRCDEIDPLIEAIADGTEDRGPEVQAHLTSCAACAARLEEARRIETWLSTRDAPLAPPAFTASVMARLVAAKWRNERVVDLGFNLALIAAALLIVIGAAGTAWSLGFFTIAIDIEALLQAAVSEMSGRVMNEVQTVLVAAAVLTMALVLWWWAEAATD